jgi:hypothetical protein
MSFRIERFEPAVPSFRRRARRRLRRFPAGDIETYRLAEFVRIVLHAMSPVRVSMDERYPNLFAF